jgi:RNA polymerase sigma-70 factor (ECF subfamily)
MAIEPITSDVRSETSSESREALYERVLTGNAPAIRRLAASYTTTASDRDDLFQEIAIAFWQALPAFRGDSSLRTYLFRIAHNRSLAMLSRKRLPLDPVDDELDAPDTRPGPEEQLLERQKHNQLMAMIRRLPIPYRQVITLAFEGMDYAEIADVLGIEIGNVGARLTRARGLLRTLMKEKKG